MTGSARMRSGAALIALGVALTLPLPAMAKPQATAGKHRVDTPLRFDPPAAGPAQSSNVGYDACIDQPSPEGAPCDCQALMGASSTAKPKAHAAAQPRRHR
jgi:hypothetical protein